MFMSDIVLMTLVRSLSNGELHWQMEVQSGFLAVFNVIGHAGKIDACPAFRFETIVRFRACRLFVNSRKG